MHINNNINRIDLHDSVFSILEKSPVAIIMELNWSILEDYREENIHDPIILGKTIITFEGVRDELFKTIKKTDHKYTNKTRSFLFGNKCKIIKYHIDDNTKSIEIEGVLSINGEKQFTYWKFNYNGYKIFSDSYFTISDWIQGNLSNHLTNILSAN